ncbi:MAG: serine/threonine-protein kinase, partial [Elusimicrobiota bacterium]
MFEELIGKEIGGCKIIKKLGEGGMGVAYSAHHGRLDRAVVVKFLDPEVAKDPKQIEGCLAEARAAARLEHPRIVQVYDQGSQDNIHFIVMQLVDGETAEDLLVREGKLEPIKAVQIIRAALEGLVEAHKAGIVHRDIKPSNILLGKDGSIRLSDFGLALKMTKEGKAKGQIIGTPLYMS